MYENTKQRKLYNFWVVLQKDGYALYKRLQELKSRYINILLHAKGLFLEAKDVVNCSVLMNQIVAELFPILSISALLVVSQSPPRSQMLGSDNNFTMRGIEKLQGYTQIIKIVKITNWSYESLLTNDEECFTYLDPPYDI